MNSIITNIITGIISGVVASVTYAIIKSILKPKIDVWDFVCVKTNSEKKCVIVKIVNKSRVRIVDIECRLQYYSKLSDGGYHTTELNSVFPTQPAIEKYINDNNAINPASLYALQNGFVLRDGMDVENKDDKLVFFFKGTHSISGTTVYKTVEFPCGNERYIKINKKFKSGTNKGYYE